MTGREHLWVPESHGQVVGFAGIKDSEITAVYVEPREARHGIGTQLLQVVERFAAAGGHRDGQTSKVPGSHALFVISRPLFNLERFDP